MSNRRPRYRYQGTPHERPRPALWRYSGLPRYRAYIPGRRGFEGVARADHNARVARQRRIQLMARRSQPEWDSPWAEGTIGPFGPYRHPYTAREEQLQSPDHNYARTYDSRPQSFPQDDEERHPIEYGIEMPREHVPQDVHPAPTPSSTPGLFDGLHDYGSGWQTDSD